MKRKIHLYLMSTLLFSLLLFAILNVLWLNNRFQSFTIQNLDNEIRTIQQLAPSPGSQPQLLVQNLAAGWDGDVRATLLDSRGNVLYDSEAPFETMENHRQRLEIKRAFVSGYGHAVRKSSTTGQTTIYVARTWGEDHVLRLSAPLSQVYDFTRNVVPVLLLCIPLLMITASKLSARLTQTLVQPYNKMLAHLETAMQRPKEKIRLEAEYTEMEPVVVYFNSLLSQLTDYISQISAKTTEIETILSSMEEGFVMLDENFYILLINQQGSRFLEIPPMARNRNITYLYRNETFLQALREVRQQQHRKIADIPSGEGRINRFYINPVHTGGYVLLISDVTELIRLEKVRSDFVANVSHELKTPLTSISGFAELIQAGMVTDPRLIVEYCSKIHSESRRLMMLIEDILKLSAIENSNQAPLQVVHMQEVFKYVLEVLTKQLETKEITVEVQGELAVMAGREHIYELVFNLVDNAIKYNVQKGSVRVNMFPGGFTVADTGLGIPEQQQARIFERFYRVDTNRSRKTGGTGLGLAISKHVAELYGGSIDVKSDSHGTAFTVYLPSAVQQVGQEPAQQQ